MRKIISPKPKTSDENFKLEVIKNDLYYLRGVVS